MLSRQAISPYFKALLDVVSCIAICVKRADFTKAFYDYSYQVSKQWPEFYDFVYENSKMLIEDDICVSGGELNMFDANILVAY